MIHVPGQAPMGAPITGQPQGNPMQKNRSVLNAQDLGRDMAEGRLDPYKTTIEQFLNMKGLTAQDPMIKLGQLAKGEVQNATPMGKMQSLAGQGQAAPGGMRPSSGMGQRPAPVQSPQAQPQGLGALMQKLQG